ncbi:MAG: FlgD immunoglobulin-like domain containing protein [Candidatus Tenebribacter burtonii]|nr:FlgD immunoglobulin-like domain containing protein [Candidatus Tenebribacter burtonii]
MKVLKMFLFLVIAGSLFASLNEQILTIEGEGIETKFELTDQINLEIEKSSITSRDSRVSMLWQTSDPGAIAGEISVSPTLENSFVQWHLNNERVSLFHDSATPLWEHVVGDLDFGYPIDMLEDGSILAIGDGSTIKIFDPNSSTPTWEYTVSNSMTGLKLAPDGLSVYVAYYYSENGVVEKYEIGNTTPIWSSSFTGGSQTLDMSGDGSTLIFTQYGGGNSFMSVLDSTDGSLIFQAVEYNQNNPAISDDASIIVNGDYSGYVHVYEFNETLETYEEKWSFNATGSGTSTWIGGMGISGDGGTIAIGTLDFITGGYNGQVFVFNTDVPVPLWIYGNFGDYVTKVDVSHDGSIIVAAGYGPLDHSTADFLLFRKESNIPVYEINTPGSMDALDLADDGSFCTVGGKAVHAREFGSGGLVYSIDCDLGGGFITGTINLEGEEDNSGAKIEIPDLVDYYAYSDYDGNFNLNNIPAGTYTVEYSKIGYIPINSNDVVVNEDETIDVGEILMESFGFPPENLMASQALGITVELNWEEPLTGIIQGYNIYRKQYESSPFPEDPFASVGEDETSYTDDTALPLINYYYVVTAILAGSFQSPYSNEVLGWISSGFVVDEISVYEGTTPTIDGVITPGEWDDAYMLDTSDFWGSYDNTIQPIGSVIGYFKMNAAMTEMYVAYVNYNDTVLEDHDEVALYIDDNNDGVFSPDTEANEGNYWAAYYAAGNQMKFRPIYNTGGTGDIFYLPDPQLEVSVDAGYLVYEFMIPIGTETWEINPSIENQSSLSIFVLNDNAPDPSGFDGWWPLDNINLFAPAGFGTITYGAVPAIPPAPENVTLDVIEDIDVMTFIMNWEMPSINDLDHFNIYFALDEEEFELIDETIGTQYIYEHEYIPTTTYRFYLTTVNQYGMESDPSEIVEGYSVDANGNIIPITTELNGNYPNPFNPTTTISFSVAQTSSLVNVEIFNIKGQKVKQLVNEVLPAGKHIVVWNGKDDNGKQAASGIYFYKMKSRDYQKSRKMLLLK